MPFATEAEQIRKFENDEVAQHYFEVLRTLISKKSIFAQQVGLKEVANYLGEIFTAAGAKVEVDDSYTAPFVIAKFFSPNPEAKTIIFYNTMIQYQLMETNLGRETLLPYQFIMGPCTVEGLMMTRGISRLVSQLFENTFVKVAICQSISPLSSKGQRSLHRLTWINT